MNALALLALVLWQRDPHALHRCLSPHEARRECVPAPRCGYSSGWASQDQGHRGRRNRRRHAPPDRVATHRRAVQRSTAPGKMTGRAGRRNSLSNSRRDKVVTLGTIIDSSLYAQITASGAQGTTRAGRLLTISGRCGQQGGGCVKAARVGLVGGCEAVAIATGRVGAGAQQDLDDGDGLPLILRQRE